MEATDYILAGTPERESVVAQDAATQLEFKKIKISHIVLSMKDYVIGNDLVRQAKAIEYLAAVLEKLDISFLSRQDVSLMVTYLATRIETAHVAGVKETALGLRALAAMSHFATNDTIEICRKIFSSSPHFNENSAPTRFEIYKLVDLFLNEHRGTIKRMEGEFINGIVSLAEQEKDPRCLMVYFSILSVILAEWDIHGEVKDLWESVSRYYPITFRAKPDDPIGITPNELKLRLRMCMAASSEFAPMAFPFLIEKLDYQVTANVKRDVMETLSACIENYDLHLVATWSSQVWDALKFEVLNATEDDLGNEALKVLQTMAEQLSYDSLTLQTLERTPLFRFVDSVAKECLKHLHEPQQRFAKQSGQIIGKIASGSPFSFHLIVKGILPELMTIIQDTHAITKKRELLEVICKILDARFELVQAQEASEFPALGILDAVSESCAVGTVAYGGLTFFRDVLFETFAVTLTSTPPQEASIRITAIKGLLRLVQLPGFLAPIEVGMIIQHFDKLILDKDDVPDGVREEAILALQEVAKLHQQMILDISFSAMLAALPDVLVDDRDAKDCLPVLEALARVGCQGFPFTILCLRLTNKLDSVLRRNFSQVYAHTILASLLYAIRQREASKSRAATETNNELGHFMGQSSEYIVLVKHLFRLVTSLKGQDMHVGLRLMEMGGVLTYPDETVLDLIGKIGMTAVRSMTVDNQIWAADQTFTLFNEFPMNEVDLSMATQLHNGTLRLSMYLLAGFHREIHLRFNPQQVCCTLIRNVSEFSESVQEVCASALGLIALLFNKWTVPSVHGLDSEAKTQPQELVLDILKTLDSKTDVQAMNVLQMSITFTMAANLKGARGTSELLSELVKLLSNKKYGSKLAKDFGLLLAPSEVLNKENFAVMRGPYKQRPYAICVPQILDLFKACTDPDIKGNYLVALAGILIHTPKDVILAEIEPLLPTLLQSMEAFGSGVKAASIEVLRTAIVESPSSVEGHLRSILKRLYDRIHNTPDSPSDSPSAVRVLALRCLGTIPSRVRDAVALPYKMEVLRELELALDDVKRNVREEAVRCRFAWFNLAEKADDSD